MSNVKNRGEVYKCNVCGNVVEVLFSGGGDLVCCGQPMEQLEEKTKEEGREKHLPIFQKKNATLKVQVGEVPHPMEEGHYIQWIEIWLDGRLCQRQQLSPGEKPEAVFALKEDFSQLKIRQLCNIHGLWAREE